MSNIVTHFYPNGEFTHGVSSSPSRKTRLERLSDKSTLERAPSLRRDINLQICAEMECDRMPVGSEFISAQNYKFIYLRRDDKTYWYAVEPPHGLPVYVTDLSYNPLRLAYLTGASSIGLSDGTNFTQIQKPLERKSSGLSRRMARKMRSCVYLMERKYSNDCLSFLTLTLPDLPKEGLESCANNWGKMVDQFLKWLRAHIGRKQFGSDSDVVRKGKTSLIDFEYTYCTEVQTKRLTKRGEYALHLHIVFNGRSSRKSAWYVTPKQVRRAWVRCIKSVYDSVFKQDSLENLQKIRKSAAKYLSKYVSKNTSGYQSLGDSVPISRRRMHWGGVSRNLGRRYQQAIYTVRSSGDGREVANLLIRGLRRRICRRSVAFYKESYIQTSRSQNGEFTRGLHCGVGSLMKPTLEGGLCQLFQELSEWWETEGCELYPEPEKYGKPNPPYRGLYV